MSDAPRDHHRERYVEQQAEIDDLRAQLGELQTELEDARQRNRVLRDRPDLRERARLVQALYGDLAVLEAENKRLHAFMTRMEMAMREMLRRLPPGPFEVQTMVENALRSAYVDWTEGDVRRAATEILSTPFVNPVIADRVVAALGNRDDVSLEAQALQAVGQIVAGTLQDYVARLESQARMLSEALQVIAAPMPENDTLTCAGCRNIARTALEVAGRIER